MKTKLWGTVSAVVAVCLLLGVHAIPASAATTSIVGGTNGAGCHDGGYFTPSSVTITSGDKITFSVPSNDPYYDGMEILGFPQGNIYVARGGSVTTQPITANVSYHGTWPDNNTCMKGSGTITVKAAASPPPSSPPASGGSSGTTSKSSSSTKSVSSTPATPANTSTPKNSSTSTSTQPTTSTSPTSDTSTTTPTSPSKSQPEASKPSSVTVTTTAKSPASKNAAALGGGGLAIIVIGLFIAWRMLARRRLHSPALQTVPVQPVATQPAPVEPSTIQPAPVESVAAQPLPVEPANSPSANTPEASSGQSPANPQNKN